MTNLVTKLRWLEYEEVTEWCDDMPVSSRKSKKLQYRLESDLNSDLGWCHDGEYQPCILHGDWLDVPTEIEE